jgi:hypothetical protein
MAFASKSEIRISSRVWEIITSLKQSNNWAYQISLPRLWYADRLRRNYVETCEEFTGENSDRKYDTG